MLGVLVVCKGVHSGRELVLTYPQNLREKNQTYFDTVHFNSSLSASSIGEHKDCVLGYPASVLADLLCPKRELWDSILDVSVESIRFIGYPVSFNSKDQKYSSNFSEQISAFNLVLVFDIESPMLKHANSIKEAVIKISKG